MTAIMPAAAVGPTHVIRYTVKPGRAEENEALIRDVFRELATAAPEGVHYMSSKQDDGLTFVHVVRYDTGSDPESIRRLPAFQRFTSTLDERCAVPPQRSQLDLMGSYGF